MKQYKKTIFYISLVLLFGVVSRIVWAEGVNYYDESRQTKKLPCSQYFMKPIRPPITSVGNKIAIRGKGFGKDTGEVIFNENIPAKIISWSNLRISVLVPEGATTGNVKVIKTCPSGKWEVSQHIKIRKTASE